MNLVLIPFYQSKIFWQQRRIFASALSDPGLWSSGPLVVGGMHHSGLVTPTLPKPHHHPHSPKQTWTRALGQLAGREYQNENKLSRAINFGTTALETDEGLRYRQGPQGLTMTLVADTDHLNPGYFVDIHIA